MTPPPVFTEEQIKEDGTNRIAKTGAQVLASQVVTIIDWVAHQAGWNGELPTPVAVSIAGILTVGVAYLMNRGRLRGEG